MNSKYKTKTYAISQILKKNLKEKPNAKLPLSMSLTALEGKRYFFSK